ncbi:hypothetical protein GQQ23_14520 [Pantoea agglomerans]|uniref:hypothetical protein n=1 Tax=Enterobacter agglomerans TaxID=549 RepID=UPI0013C60790|nr:hypothetical protein [Pantoea agglomerans]NEG63544.1 hypothetical protein [Pantoea agglomerans]
MLLVIELTTCSIQSNAEEREGYNQSDFFLYQLITNTDIKKAPRISNDYFFKYQTRNGSAAEQSTIIFRNISDPSALKLYLKKLGYHVAEKENDSERWEKNSSAVSSFYLWVNKELDEVGLSKATY